MNKYYSITIHMAEGNIVKYSWMFQVWHLETWWHIRNAAKVTSHFLMTLETNLNSKHLKTCLWICMSILEGSGYCKLTQKWCVRTELSSTDSLWLGVFILVRIPHLPLTHVARLLQGNHHYWNLLSATLMCSTCHVWG